MRIQEILKLLKAHWSGSRRVEDVAGFDPVERALGQRLPADYKYFLMWSNGGESLDPLRHMTFYPLEELLPRRADGQPPDVLEFCTDDSDGFAFDLTRNRDIAAYPVIRYPLGDTERVEIEPVGRDLASFLRELLGPLA